MLSFSLTFDFSFSYDLRGSHQKGNRWADPMLFGDQRHPNGIRVLYNVDVDPPRLTILDVRKEDANDYRCRIDFQKSNSEFAWVILKVVGKSILLNSNF